MVEMKAARMVAMTVETKVSDKVVRMVVRLAAETASKRVVESAATRV